MRRTKSESHDQICLLPCEYSQRLPNHRSAVKASVKLLPHSHCRQSYPAPGSVATTGRGEETGRGKDTVRPRGQLLAKALAPYSPDSRQRGALPSSRMSAPMLAATRAADLLTESRARCA